MILIANFLGAFATILNVIFNLLLITLFLSAIFSWFPSSRNNQVVRAIDSFTDVILSPIRKRLKIRSGIDFSFIIVFLIIIFLQVFLVSTLFDYSQALKRM